ncbi:MAG TPA: hypothetical protein PLZ62_00050 [bacterium]|nr:hypothetical protein [bacterium]
MTKQMVKEMKEKANDNSLLYQELKKYIQELEPEIFYPVPYKKNVNIMPPAIKETSQWFVELPCYNANIMKSNIQKLADEQLIQLKQENEVVYFRKTKNWDKKDNHPLNPGSEVLAEIKKEIKDLRGEINNIKQRLAQKDAQIIKLTKIIRAENIRKET